MGQADHDARPCPAGLQRAVPSPPAAPGAREDQAIRASDRERDAATHRLQEGFAEGRLDDAEFDQRMRAARPGTGRPVRSGSPPRPR